MFVKTYPKIFFNQNHDMSGTVGELGQIFLLIFSRSRSASGLSEIHQNLPKVLSDYPGQLRGPKPFAQMTYSTNKNKIL